MALHMWLYSVPVSQENKTIVGEESYELAHWRYANQIRGWFARKLGLDNEVCETDGVRVPRQAIVELLDTCKKVIGVYYISGDTILGESLLPTVFGPYFGSDAYDEDYIHAIRDTIEMLENILDNEDERSDYEVDIYYCESW